MKRIFPVLCLAALIGAVGCLPAAAQSDNAGVNLQTTQIAALTGDGGQYIPVVGTGGRLYPVNNGNGHYICTPSGFGHIATCALRNAD
jgi:hypothetical protein